MTTWGKFRVRKTTPRLSGTGFFELGSRLNSRALAGCQLAPSHRKCCRNTLAKVLHILGGLCPKAKPHQNWFKFRTKLRHRFNDMMCKYNQIHVAHRVAPLSSSLHQRKLGQSRKTFGSRLCLEVSLRQGASQSAEGTIVRPRRPRNI